ncbi:prenyltransferase/squalene oxidase repeat-containing protein [Nonomuraea sp. NPDC048826]|uniref:prenyltransferase/squalene oxidase repeat-containing protein n=1 Tax=Nonomuraea sp. NPDC048826 TaxID=3364347 RepID=UPI0037230F0F
MSTDIARRAADLVTGLMATPWGQVSPSVYETGRLVTLAPWLVGHRERIAFLLAEQGADGSWGQPGGYRLVPTLSATEALMSAARDGSPEVLPAAEAGLAALRDMLARPAELPDTPAIDLIVPALVALIDAHGPGEPLPCPPGLDGARLRRVRRLLESGQRPPQKILHVLEVVAAQRPDGVLPTPAGTVGASPAATAAWLGGSVPPDPPDPPDAADSAVWARRYLEAVAKRFGGPVPVGLPITVFERGWVLSWLARAGIRVEAPPEMIADLRATIGPEGTPAGAGLPADADTTSVALHALALLGAPCDPAPLLAFDTGTHYCTWQGEDGFSPTTNAHVLDAFGAYVRVRPAAVERYGPVMARVARWLAERQRPDGSWDDRWHASPYYATLGCALALGEFGGPEHAGAVLRAREWVLAAQREDGSWGRWTGTPEETAYAVQTLLLSGPEPDERCKRAAGRGHDYLLQSADLPHFPPLWHDKDLYSPTAIVRAAILAALHVAECHKQQKFNRINGT